VRHTAHLRSVPLGAEDTEDVAAEILLQIVARDYAVLRQFRGQASLATYLTVVARRICIHELGKRAGEHEAANKVDGRQRAKKEREEPPRTEVGLESLEEVQKLLRKLPTRERQIVRLYYLEGRTYEEIATQLHISVNSIGPILSRAKQKLRLPAKKPPQAPRREQNPNNP